MAPCSACERELALNRRKAKRSAGREPSGPAASANFARLAARGPYSYCMFLLKTLEPQITRIQIANKLPNPIRMTSIADLPWRRCAMCAFRDTLFLFAGRKRPVDYARALERPPHQNRLKRQSGAMIPPAVGHRRKVDGVGGMLDVGGKNADRIKREHPTSDAPPTLGHQRDAAGKLAS